MKTLGEFLDAVAHLPRDTEMAFQIEGEGRAHLEDVTLSNPDNFAAFFGWGQDRDEGLRVGAVMMKRTRQIKDGPPPPFDLLMISVVPPEDFC